MLKNIAPTIQKLVNGQDLTYEESLKAFSTLFEKDLESYYFFTFMAAIHTKGETSDELLAFCKATEEIIPKIEVDIDIDKIIDLSGTGGDKVKTMNVGTAATFILPSQNIYVPKQAFFAVTGPIGSGDLLGSFGVDVMDITMAGTSRVGGILKNVGIVTYIAQFLGDPKKTKGIANWVDKRKEIGLNFITPFHLASNAYTPIPMTHRLYGVFDKKYLHVLAELFQKMGYKRGMIYHGDIGLDEISNIGTTSVCEFSTDNIEEYALMPSDFGIKEAKVDDIRATGRDENIIDFIRVLYGKDVGPKRDLVCITASAAFHVLGVVSDFKEGTELAKKIIEEGKARQKFESYIEMMGDKNKLKEWKRKAKIE